MAAVCAGALAAEVAFETVALGVEAGPGVVKEETGRLLARVVFGRLQAALDGRLIKALVVNENLNLGKAVAEEARKLAGDAPVGCCRWSGGIRTFFRQSG